MDERENDASLTGDEQGQEPEPSNEGYGEGYDDQYGEDLFDDQAENDEEIEGQEDGEQEAQPDVQAVQDAPLNLAQTSLPTLFTQDELETLQEQIEMGGTAALQAQIAISTRIAAYQQQAQAVSNQHVFAGQARYPQWFAKYGANVQKHISTLKPDVQAQPAALYAGMLAAVYDEISQSGDVAGVFERHARLLRGNAGQIAAQQQQRPPTMRPAQRTPGGRGTAQPVRRQSAPATGREAVRRFADEHGMSLAEARLAMLDPHVSG